MAKKYTVELTKLAQEQIVQIARYVSDKLQAPDAAIKLVDKLEAEISKLETMPKRVVLVNKEPWTGKGVHKFVIDDYIAYFIIMEPKGVVRVIAVVLGRMDQIKQLKKTGV